MSTETKQLSKFLSLLLRHHPESIGLKLDAQGWANVEELLTKLNASGKSIDLTVLEEIVATNNKKRFAFNEDHTRIRASQGHSIEIDLGLRPSTPPDLLFHGTAATSLQSILSQGLIKQNRQHVHLSSDPGTARTVGSRHGQPIILQIDAKKMQEEGHLFYISENGVWLTDNVPPLYISQ